MTSATQQKQMPRAPRIHVLLYAGAGATPQGLIHVRKQLSALLSGHYDVVLADHNTICNEPWEQSTALLVMPGGRDVPYTQHLNGEGTRRIRAYVRDHGGRYLGLCAGAYFGAREIEFEKGVLGMEVVGERELRFFDGMARGSVYGGFAYNSETGAHAARIALADNKDEQLHVYFNGGCYFDMASLSQPPFMDVVPLARYTQYSPVFPVQHGDAQDSTEYPPAIIECTFASTNKDNSQRGKVVLSGVHPEYSAHDLDEAAFPTPNTYNLLLASEAQRDALMRWLLGERLGLKLNPVSSAPSPTPVPQDSSSLSVAVSPLHDPLYVCSPSAAILDRFHAALVSQQKGVVTGLQVPIQYADVAMADIVPVSSITSVLEDYHDAFYVVQSGSSSSSSSSTAPVFERMQKMFWPLVFDGQKQQPPASAHMFSIERYFAALQSARSATGSRQGGERFGDLLMYSDCITSTQTTIEQNPTYQSLLPTLHNGFGPVVVAYRQTAGRGRGRNSWISPPGCLQVSFVLRCEQADASSPARGPENSLPQLNGAHAVFLQYLVGTAIAEAVKMRVPSLPVFLKWPNDIYARPRKDDAHAELVKIGGILVNSSFMGGRYDFTVGLGINIDNAAPTSALNSLDCDYTGQDGTPFKFTLEQTLADVVATFDQLFDQFLRGGFTGAVQQTYYKHWLHSGQVVQLGDTAAGNNGGRPVRIVGLDEFGFLKTVDVDRPQDVFVLQPDGNSFDMMKGLISRKVT
ncbi:biotin holocarboxylase synthetase [Sorochytrium milnesiophthora]